MELFPYIFPVKDRQRWAQSRRRGESNGHATGDAVEDHDGLPKKHFAKAGRPCPCIYHELI